MISIITPAHNEENYIGKCIASVKTAAEFAKFEYEHIVVLNRCTDKTESIALAAGCKIVQDETKNISHIRNTGISLAKGDIIVTIDADSWMSPNMLSEVVKMLNTDRYIGGGVREYQERYSLGIVCSLLFVLPSAIRHGIWSAGLLWFYKNEFEIIGGFDETLSCLEDIDICSRLKSYGKTIGKKYGTIRKAHIIKSSRKFDQFGDWHLVRHPKLAFDLLINHKKEAIDAYWYDVRNDPEK